MNNTLNKQYGVSILRLISTILIVVCHMFQAYDNNAAFYLNIGVPIFLSISGYLYGKKEKVNTITFFKNRFIRVLIPYYTICVVVFLSNLFLRKYATLKQVLSMVLVQQAFGESLANCGHLWFISLIVFCYLITPLLWQIRDSLKLWQTVIACSAISLLCIGIIFVNSLPINCIYVIAYIIGFVLASLSTNSRFNKCVWGGRVLTTICIIGYVLLYVGDKRWFSVPGIVLYIVKIFVSILLLICAIEINYYPKDKVRKALDFCDLYSYSVYLCHHIWILGAFSIIGLTEVVFIDVSLALLAVILTSIVFGVAINWFTKKLINKQKRTS